jgi:hypothetical protein
MKPIYLHLNWAKGDVVTDSEKLIITRSIASKSTKSSKETLPILVDLTDN